MYHHNSTYQPLRVLRQRVLGTRNAVQQCLGHDHGQEWVGFFNPGFRFPHLLCTHVVAVVCQKHHLPDQTTFNAKNNTIKNKDAWMSIRQTHKKKCAGHCTVGSSAPWYKGTVIHRKQKKGDSPSCRQGPRFLAVLSATPPNLRPLF